MAIVINDYKIDSPVILAPMSGVTDKPFRKIVRRYGAPLLVTEMIASRSMIAESRQSFLKRDFDHEGGLTSVQLAGCEPDVMAEAAKMNEDFGAKMIDINFGCPAKKVVNSYSGSALMRDEVKAAKILEATVKAVNIPVTLKMRKGWDDNSLNAPTLARIAEDVGIKMITVHGRTRCQFYSGKADWSFIKNIKDVVDIPVVVNGDIKTEDDIDAAMKESCADGVMIGRGAYGKPWIINQACEYISDKKRFVEPSIAEKFQVILEHFEESLLYYGNVSGLLMFRKHLSWYTQGLHNSAKFRAEINQLSNIEAVKKAIANYFKDLQELIVV